MSQYRKLPVVIDAYQIPPDDDQTRELPPNWLLDAIQDGRVWQRGDSWAVKLNDTDHVCAKVSDWVIKGVEGELYPCADSVFQATYEKVV